MVAKKKPSASKESGNRRAGQIPFALKWLNVTLFHAVMSRLFFFFGVRSFLLGYTGFERDSDVLIKLVNIKYTML